jgi:hypothetical protein
VYIYIQKMYVDAGTLCPVTTHCTTHFTTQFTTHFTTHTVYVDAGTLCSKHGTTHCTTHFTATHRSTATPNQWPWPKHSLVNCHESSAPAACTRCVVNYVVQYVVQPTATRALV